MIHDCEAQLLMGIQQHFKLFLFNENAEERWETYLVDTLSPLQFFLLWHYGSAEEF